MAAAVTAHWNMRLQVVETRALSADHASDPNITWDIEPTTRGTMNAMSTPAVSKTFVKRLNLVGGTLTIDLTALIEDNGDTVDFSTLKVQAYKLACPSTNTASITVTKKDASTGYSLFGEDNVSSESVELMPEDVCQFKRHDTLEDVDATHKDITFTGTGTEAIDVALVAG